MKNYISNQPYNSVPTAYITNRKQRIKQYPNNHLYLNDGDEYEIELFNPLFNDILAKIYIDDNLISSGGIIIKPGQRIFLERYVDTPNKFKFTTYHVNGLNNEVKNAIKNNGNIKIKFYDKYIPVENFPINNIDYTYWNSNPIYRSGTAIYNTEVHDTGISYTNISNSNYNISNYVSNTIETGKTEKGSYSNQKFVNSYESFNTVSFHSVNWKILPKSVKPHTATDINILYCGNCGTKRKKQSHKFCPICGTKF